MCGFLTLLHTMEQRDLVPIFRKVCNLQLMRMGEDINQSDQCYRIHLKARVKEERYLWGKERQGKNGTRSIKFILPL